MVRWRESMLNMADAGVEEFVELGGKVLGSMVKRTVPDAQVTLHLDDGELGIHAPAGRGEAYAHPLARREHPFAHIRGTLAPVVPQSLEGHTRNVHAQVDAVEQWPRELAAIPLDLLRKTRAFALGVAPKSARARIHRRDENEPRRVRRCASGARDRDGVLLQRLAERVEHAA